MKEKLLPKKSVSVMECRTMVVPLYLEFTEDICCHCSLAYTFVFLKMCDGMATVLNIT